MKRHRTPPLVTGSLVTLVYATVNIAAPLALSTHTRRAGWNGRPSVRNLLGIPLLAAGAGIIVWSAASHATHWQERDWRVLKLDPDHLLTPEYLVTDGPYQHSRNPLYVGDILMWAGWSILLGSVPVAVGVAVLTLGLQVGVRLEERRLARQFGDRWTAYVATVPRFIGRRRDVQATPLPRWGDASRRSRPTMTSALPTVIPVSGVVMAWPAVPGRPSQPRR